MQTLKTPIKVDQFLYKATRFHLFPCRAAQLLVCGASLDHTVRFTVPPQCIRVNSYTEPLASRLSNRQKDADLSRVRTIGHHWAYRPGSVFCTSQATDHIGFQVLKLFSFSLRPGHTPVSFHSPGTPLSSLSLAQTSSRPCVAGNLSFDLLAFRRAVSRLVQRMFSEWTFTASVERCPERATDPTNK